MLNTGTKWIKYKSIQLIKPFISGNSIYCNISKLLINVNARNDWIKMFQKKVRWGGKGLS